MRRKGEKHPTRPLEDNEYYKILELLQDGFKYTVDGKEKVFRPNYQIAIILFLEANVGLRVGDILSLKLSNFRGKTLSIVEDKTDKLMDREIEDGVINIIMRYAIDNGIKKDQKLFNITTRAVQKQLKIVCDYLGLDHISTHSFRKMYATNQYQKNNNDIYLVKDLLNHASIATTQKYIMLNKEKVNKASKSYNIGGIKY